MARTALTPIQAAGAYVSETTALAWNAADDVDGNEFVLTGRELVLIHNTDDANPHSVELTSVNDPFGRLGTITEEIAAGSYRIFGPIEITGWQQADGKFYLSADSSAIEFAVIRLLK